MKYVKILLSSVRIFHSLRLTHTLEQLIKLSVFLYFIMSKYKLATIKEFNKNSFLQTKFFYLRIFCNKFIWIKQCSIYLYANLPKYVYLINLRTLRFCKFDIYKFNGSFDLVNPIHRDPLLLMTHFVENFHNLLKCAIKIFIYYNHIKIFPITTLIKWAFFDCGN